MKNKLAKLLQSLIVTSFIVLQAVLLGGYIKLKKEQTMLHDALWHTQQTLSNHIVYATGKLGANHTHNMPEMYKEALKAMNEMQRRVSKLIDIVRKNGEYCVRKGDVGCGQ